MQQMYDIQQSHAAYVKFICYLFNINIYTPHILLGINCKINLYYILLKWDRKYLILNHV